MREETKTIYYINCKMCKKEFSFKERPDEYGFKCKKCLSDWKEPKREDFETFQEYIHELESWIWSTAKESSYDFWSEKFKEDVWKEFKIDYKKNKTKLERAWEIASDRASSESRSYFLEILEELFEIM